MPITRTYLDSSFDDAVVGSIAVTVNSTGFTHIVVFVKHEDAVTTITVDDNKGSGVYHALTKETHSGVNLHGQMFWQKIGTPGTSHTVTATFGGTRQYSRMHVWGVVAGTGNIALDDQTTNEGTGTSSINGGTLTTTAATVSMMGVGEFTTVTYTATGGWSEDAEEQNSYAGSRADASGTFDATVTSTPAMTWVCCAASFRETTTARLQVRGDLVYTDVAVFNGDFNNNVATGSLLIVSAARWRSNDATAFVSGDLTKVGGTATISSPVIEYTGSPDVHQRVGVWSCLVTAGGSLTLRVTHSGANCYGSMFLAEFSGTWDASRVEDTSSDADTGSSADSGNATSVGGAVFVGSYCDNDGGVPTITEDSAFELIGEDEDGTARIVHSAIDRIVSSGTTDSASWTSSNAPPWVAGVVVFKEASGGGGSFPSRWATA